jgi:hypothetical protein
MVMLNNELQGLLKEAVMGILYQHLLGRAEKTSWSE